MSDHKVPPPVFSLTSGPVDCYPQVLRALSRTVLYDFDPTFQAFYEAVNEKLRVALRLRAPPVILHGEPVLGLEAAAASLIAADDVVLNLVSGVYGKGFGYWAARYAKEVVEVEIPYNEALDPAAVEDALRRRPEVAVVAVVHHDTPSGTINPVAEIGRIVTAHGACLIVDAVPSFAGMDVHPEACGADLFVTGPNKCLGGPPGLTLLGVSERAWAKMRVNRAAPRASILSILDWEHAWRRDQPFPFTPSIAEINALDAALDLYLEEGPEPVWRRHALTAEACRAGLAAMGLDIWPDSAAIASPTTTAVRVPAELDDAAWRAAARAIYGVTFSSGRGVTAGKLLRIGHMGPTAQPIFAPLALSALGGAARSLGHAVDLGAGLEAAVDLIHRRHQEENARV